MKTSLLLFSIFLSIIIYANINYLHGIIGMTLRDGGTGCVCHNDQPTDSVVVWIEGPDTVHLSDTSNYKLFMTGGPAETGGFNLASYSGILDTIDPLTLILSDELTHTTSKQFINDTVFWIFSYIAPDSIIVDTLYAVGNSTNNDSIPTSLDLWNHAQNFTINVIEEPVYVEDRNILPEKFILFQNFPNPFNPATIIKFQLTPDDGQITNSELVTLTVYDLLGNEVAILIHEDKFAGTYEVEFDAKNLRSGIYFYTLRTKTFVQTKKMLLIK